MVRKIDILSRDDVKKIVKEQVDKKTFQLERLINYQQRRIQQIEEELNFYRAERRKK